MPNRNINRTLSVTNIYFRIKAYLQTALALRGRCACEGPTIGHVCSIIFIIQIKNPISHCLQVLSPSIFSLPPTPPPNIDKKPCLYLSPPSYSYPFPYQPLISIFCVMISFKRAHSPKSIVSFISTTSTCVLNKKVSHFSSVYTFFFSLSK